MDYFGTYVTCPFDKSHRIIDGRLEKHLFKCRKNYPKNTKVTCPFDARHLLDPEEYEHHISTCPSSGNVKCYQQSLGVEKKIGLPIEATCNVETSSGMCDEDWSGGNASYDPIAATEGKNVVRTIIGLSKAQRKQFRLYERERLAKLEKKSNNTIDDMDSTKKSLTYFDSDEPLRLPNTIPKVVLYDKDVQMGDLLSKLKKVDLNKDSTLLEKNVSKTNNSFSQESSIENSASNVSSENSFQCSGQGSIRKKTINMTRNEIRSCAEFKDKDKLRHARVAAKFREAKKFTTGRGFTIACRDILETEFTPEERATSHMHLNCLYAYDDDDEDDNHDVASQSK